MFRVGFLVVCSSNHLCVLSVDILFVISVRIWNVFVFPFCVKASVYFLLAIESVCSA